MCQELLRTKGFCPHSIHALKSLPPCDGWEVMRSRWWSPYDGISVLEGERAGSLLLLCSPLCEDTTQRRPWANQVASSHQRLNLRCLHLGFPASRTDRNTCKLFKYMVFCDSRKDGSREFLSVQRWRNGLGSWRRHLGAMQQGFLSHHIFTNACYLLSLR